MHVKMVRAIQLCVIFITLITFGNTVAKENTLNIRNSRNLSEKSVIRKCCPFGQYVQKVSPTNPILKRCASHSKKQNFSSVHIFDKDIYETGKLFDDVFIISDGMFVEHPEFCNNSIAANNLGFEPHLIEDGTLQMQLRNVYPQWRAVASGNFCIDYAVSRTNLTSPYSKFWIVLENKDGEDKNINFTAASLISCVFMLLVLVVYGLLPELQNLCGLILMAYVASLCMAFMLLAIMQLVKCSDVICIILSFGVYYFFLASFCWMTVMSYDIWWTFRGYAKACPIHRRGERFKFLMYCLYAFGVPFLMSIVLGVLNWTDMSSVPWFITPNLLKEACFIDGMSKMLYLYTPLLILNICNWIFFLMTAFNLWRLHRATAILDSAEAGTAAAHRTQMHRLVVYLKLTVVMGLNWVLEVISFAFPGTKFWYLTDIYNGLIGLIIFLIFVCKKKILRKLYKRLWNTNHFRTGSSKNYSRSGSTTDTRETTVLQRNSRTQRKNSNTITGNI